MKRKSSGRHSPTYVYAMIMMGIGFISLGVMLYWVLGSSKADSISEEYSTVPVKVNIPAPALELKDIQGNKTSLKDYLGKVTLVNMWATWCPPCKAEMPTLETFYETYKKDGFVIIGINDGDALDLVAHFAKDYGLTFPIWLDEAYLSEKTFNTMNLPSSYVIDRGGTIRLMWIGAVSKKTLEKYVPSIIKE